MKWNFESYKITKQERDKDSFALNVFLIYQCPGVMDL